MAKSPDWPTFKATQPPIPPEVLDSIFRHALAKMVMPSFDRSAVTEFRSTADRRITAIALAARRYALDHGGKLPAKLDDLVPTYLPAIPADPFATGGATIKYVADPDKPLVYSINEDGVDQGGNEQPAKPRPTAAPKPNRWDGVDAVLHLTLQPRPPAATQQANDDGLSDGVGDLNLTTQPATQP
jgi:hypothetical protein